jgi:predicted RNase H-like HicB family nuclease
MKTTLTLEYWLDNAWFVGRLKEVPGVFSQGKSLDELKKNVIDAYRMILDDQDRSTHEDAMTCAIEVAV